MCLFVSQQLDDLMGSERANTKDHKNGQNSADFGTIGRSSIEVHVDLLPKHVQLAEWFAKVTAFLH